MVTGLRSALQIVAPLVMFALVDATHGAAQPAGPGSASRLCRVVNETQGTRFSPDRGAVLAAAIAAANAGDRLEITGTCTGTYTLNQDIVLAGVRTRAFPIPTLDGGQAGATVTVAAGVTATLSELTITGGTGKGGSLPGLPTDGGGIFNNGTLTLISCVVSGNRATFNGNGGGIFNAGALVLQGGSTVSNNSAENEGGGIYNAVSTATVTMQESSTLSGNSAGDFGGGIANFGALIVDASTIAGNRAGFGGGGIRNYIPGTATLRNSSTVSDNRVMFEGAGILNHGTLIVDSSVLSRNIGSASGGAISNNGGTVTLNSSTVSGNENGIGAGIFNGGGTVTLNSSLVTDNTAVLAGGGIYNGAGTVQLNASAVTGNVPDNCLGVQGC
jgi:hypothetical protein